MAADPEAEESATGRGGELHVAKKNAQKKIERMRTHFLVLTINYPIPKIDSTGNEAADDPLFSQLLHKSRCVTNDMILVKYTMMKHNIKHGNFRLAR